MCSNIFPCLYKIDLGKQKHFFSFRQEMFNTYMVLNAKNKLGKKKSFSSVCKYEFFLFIKKITDTTF